MKMECLVFPGRFQPMTRGHVACLETIRSSHEVGRIVIAFPNNRVRNQENPFFPEETERIIRLSLPEVEPWGVEVNENLYNLWQKYIGNFQFQGVITGNRKMAKIIEVAGRGKVQAICFDDGSVSQIRASTVREMIRRREEGWREMVAPGVAEYIEGLPIEWQNLPKGRKRWYR